MAQVLHLEQVLAHAAEVCVKLKTAGLHGLGSLSTAPWPVTLGQGGHIKTRLYMAKPVVGKNCGC
jgi:hypothetical protein